MPDISTTLAYTALVKDGKTLFLKRMAAANGQCVMKQIAGDVESMLNDGLNHHKSMSANIQLSRLVGYVGAMAELIGGLPTIGFRFDLTTDAGGEPHLNGDLVFTTSNRPEAQAPKKEPPSADIDTLEGPEYEAALAKMTPAERKKYLAAA